MQGFELFEDFDVFDTDDSDDEVIILSRPPSPLPPPPPLPRVVVRIGRLEISIPKVTPDLQTAYSKAKKIEPGLRPDRLCEFFEQVLRLTRATESLVDRIVIIGTDIHARPFPPFTREANTILRALFPRYAANDLTRVLNDHGFLSAAYLWLKHWPTPTFLKTPRPFPGPLDVNLVPVALELLEIVGLDAEETRAESARAADQERAVRFERARRAQQLVECECCFGEFLADELSHCDAGHRFCRVCLVRSIDTLIGEGRADLRCLALGGCEARVSMEELERCVPEKKLKLLFAMEAQAAVEASGIAGLVRCHRCGNCVEYEGACNFKCPDCQSETCVKCGSVGHEGLSCDQFGEIDKDRFVEERMNEAVVRVCPKCKAQFMKEEGCNKMECPRCRTWSCYWCRKEIPREVGYAHFWRAQGVCPPDRCPLWVADTTLHRLEAVHAKEQTAEELWNDQVNM